MRVEFLWKSWDDRPEVAVFHSETGQTHLLDELSAWVVKLIQNGPLSQPELSARLIQEYGANLNATDVERFLQSLLPQLCQLGIVEESSLCS